MFSAVSSNPTGISGLGVLLSEAVSVLNGAHLNPAGRLGSFFRRYHHVVATATETDDSAPLSSALLSELGIRGLNSVQWRRAMEGVLTTSPPVTPTVQSIIRQYTGPLRSNHLWQPVRRFSTFPSKWVELRMGYGGRSSIPQLEERANDEYDDPQAQVKYMEAVLHQDPEYVIRRFESGRYAVNTAVREIYLQAVELAEIQRSGNDRKAPMSIFSSLMGNQANQSINSQSSVGSRENPMHVIPLPRKGEFLRQLWYLARFLIGMGIIVSLFSSSLVSSVKSGSQQMTKDFKPDPTEKLYTFDDVQGVDEAKSEVEEIVDFLRNPEKFQRLGAKLPTGLLLIGPPGTGKTLLAKAIAGEAKVPFFFASGSEFDEMFVGVGASRVRKLFEQARLHKPCVVFIDELDAVGGARVANSVHPYSRMTLNQLLVEMDGYKELEGVVIIGATNFPESLDKALIRPGRFDSQINIPLPDVRARFQILKVHAKKVTVSDEVNLETVARGTSGFTGADLANLINQAALHGSAAGGEAVTSVDLEFAKDKIIMGAERRSAVIQEKNRKIVAFHEGGHAIVALYTPEALPIHKATIVPRGQALGMVVQLPENDELSWSKKQLLARMDVAMGGRVAEELVFGADNITGGAGSDLESATKIARAMVTKFGMTEAVGPVTHGDNASPGTQKVIDDEIKRILKESYERAVQLLKTHSVEHRRLAEALLKHETLTADEIRLAVAGKTISKKL
ncbi:uncharacterized protein LOC135344579 [Halichondria panicea]|uniref:uncharacterized protein LOC135344579 n=1 Tax=Halichondria panicea TaxID=6063 RepID=UPI00312B5378